MPASDLVYRLPKKWDAWGIRRYFCPGCGRLVTDGYVTRLEGNQCWGAHTSRGVALRVAEAIFGSPECFSCFWGNARIDGF